MAFASILALLLLPLATLLAQAQTNNITLGSSLTADDHKSSWKSPSGDFAFGFRKIGASGFLLAIWFDKIPEKTVIWSVNGNNLAPEGSTVNLTGAGRLVLNDPDGAELWAQGTASGASYTSMLDIGNFILADKTGSSSWESFGQPSDTIVPTQVLGLGMSINSRSSAMNYSTGRFQLIMQSNGNLVMYTLRLLEPSNAYWSIQTMGSGYQVVFNRTGRIYLTGMNGTVLDTVTTGTVPSGDYYQRAVIDYDGVFRQYIYPRNGGPGSALGWSTVSSPVPPNICLRSQRHVGIGACGHNSYCVLGDNQRPRCKCPPGYSYTDPSNEMNGCKPDFLPQSCNGEMSESDSFTIRDMINTDWPLSDYENYKNQTEDSCRRACLNDCYCDLAKFSNGNCWMKRMPLSNGVTGPSIRVLTFIKVRTGKLTSKIPNTGLNNNNRNMIIIASALLSISAALNLIILVWFRFNRGKRSRTVKPDSVTQITSTVRSFTYKELLEATGGFKEELGKGAFGVVYKGLLTSGGRSINIAVKVLQKLTSEGDREFKTEVDTIGRTNHKNLVRLVGFCNEGQNRLLVYEFMPNRSLAGFLFRGRSRPSWLRRVEIASGVARGLLYLHEECSEQIIHCDVKPQNILLDEFLTAKICDFGLAKLLMSGQTRTMTEIRGTKGYVALEWFRNVPVSAKVDVYSFGIVLLEIICCRKSCEIKFENEGRVILRDWVYDCYHGGRLGLIVEGDSEALDDMITVRRFVMIALWCIQEEPSLRPTMKKVSQMLEGAVEVPIPPQLTSFISSM